MRRVEGRGPGEARGIVRVALLSAGLLLLTAVLVAQGGHTLFAYQAALREYVSGDALGAVESLAAWSDDDLERAARQMPLEDEHRIQLPGSAAAVRSLFGMAALHAEAAVTSRTAERFRVNAKLGEQAIKALSRQPGAERFSTTWYLTIAAFAVVLGDVNVAASSLSAAHGLVGNDDEVLVARGALDELSAGPFRVEPDLAGLSFRERIDVRDRLEPTAFLRGARDAYLAALRANPANAEARLRLGRVLSLLGDQEESFDHLSRCRQLGASPEVACLCRLFLAELYEQRGRPRDAEEALREAAALVPNALSPILALGRLLDMNGRTEEAVPLIVAALRRARAAGEPPDPWWRYEMNQLTDPKARLMELRGMARAAAR